jgi:hypothetical protein
MNAIEFICDLLCELDQADLAKTVRHRLENKDVDEAWLPLRFAGGGSPREINVNHDKITVEME